ncbi:Z1 domain-containing protein [Streptomyces meridianus]|uniref:Z1 domain-containing protein n=1 Tax=Streptomyces meridianus TaxID=2938945 RepID=A0ABT0WZX7_9ACTN|nr:Z1 domain-containing protein [Streptomyces meridianus]MCM2575861.1 Z1 domain-containing protein [Streptomyces meridianus]
MTTEDTTSLSDLLDVHDAVLAGMQKTGPQPMAPALGFYAGSLGREATDLSQLAFRQALTNAPADHPLLWLWRKQLTEWDFRTGADWSATEPRTDERRAAVHEKLGFDAATREVIDTLIPVQKLSGSVVISREFTPWRTLQSQQGRDWYWPKYAGLLASKGWSAEAVAKLDNAAERVVERLADPTAERPYQSRGLVVGYVQSGKTANFTGVIAKAIDAGYRLVIVLGGTLNLLRAQTQRRLDMELAGRENILRSASEVDSDYATDADWNQDKFLRHGGLPSQLGAFDIIRLTTRENDYKPLAQGIGALEIEKREQTSPLYDPLNLHHSAARLMVVKKNKTVLGKLVKDLKKIGSLLNEIPVLIIDDESDEASVNTANPNKPDAERTAINGKISELLKLMPRSQYVGYTATPFANVFVDPSDTEDIFPRDFIISLDRPIGYMGIQEFHDIDSDIPPEDRTFANSQARAHVRDVRASEDEDDASLREAVDMFVLTAAMKIYREFAGAEPLGAGHFRHHTMLVHESRLTADHRELANCLLRLWYDGGFTGPDGHQRLRKLFDADVAPVSAARAEGFAVPASFEELAPHIGAAWMRIGGNESPIIVVNGDKDIERGEADFDQRGIWKILVGGQKLSRGYTVEGLTVTYYRRSAGNSSTLMQMGRWFGFRKGYQDLVRLYIGREESTGKREVDLYEAFEAICRDEELFREELRQYSVMVDGKPQVTPAQVPPLVSQHLPWLKPTSPNKMYNARLVEVRSAGRWIEPTAYPKTATALRQNTQTWIPVLESLSEDTVEFSQTDENGMLRTFRAFAGLLPSEELLPLLRSLKWKGEQFAPHLAFIESIVKETAQAEDWLILAPQHAGPGKRASFGPSGRTLSWFDRARRRDPLFGAISEPKHRAAPLRVAGALPSCEDPVTERFVSERRGVISLYPVVEPDQHASVQAGGVLDPSNTVMAFSFVAPAAAERPDHRLVRFTTVDSSREEAPIISC